jgi:hypothetical protein
MISIKNWRAAGLQFIALFEIAYRKSLVIRQGKNLET